MFLFSIIQVLSGKDSERFTHLFKFFPHQHRSCTHMFTYSEFCRDFSNLISSTTTVAPEVLKFKCHVKYIFRLQRVTMTNIYLFLFYFKVMHKKLFKQKHLMVLVFILVYTLLSFGLVQCIPWHSQ